MGLVARRSRHDPGALAITRRPFRPNWRSKHLQVTADFLIGWRVGILTHGSYLCPDPQIVAGVQARCSGNLYLSRRDPDLSWERLLSEPIAFDEPDISALFP